MDLEAFQHFVCLTGNFYSPPVYFMFILCLFMFSFRLMPWCVPTAGTALSAVAYPSNVFLSSGKLRMGSKPLPFPFLVTFGAGLQLLWLANFDNRC